MIINLPTFESRENLKQSFEIVNIALSSNVHFIQYLLIDWLVITAYWCEQNDVIQGEG